MPYNIPRLPYLIAQSHANIQSKLPDTNTSLKNSELAALAYNQAALVSGLYHHQKWIALQAVPHTADDDYFLAYAKEDGIYRKAASQAFGAVTVISKQPVIILKDLQLQRTDGALFKVAVETHGTGTFTIPVVSLEAGLNQNTDAGAVLTFVSPVLYVDNVAEVISITGGADIEPMSEVRERYIFRCQYPPMGGNKFDYIRWARECAGVTRAWSFPRIYGGNTVGIAWVYDGRYRAGEPDSILPLPDDINLVMDYIDHHADPLTNQMVGHSAGAEVIKLNVTIKPINPEIILFPNDEAIRTNAESLMRRAVNTISMPAGSIPRSHLTQAISNAVGEYDHRLIIPDNSIDIIESSELELLTLGDITWR